MKTGAKFTPNSQIDHYRLLLCSRLPCITTTGWPLCAPVLSRRRRRSLPACVLPAPCSQHMVDKTRSESVGLNNTCAVHGSNCTATLGTKPPKTSPILSLIYVFTSIRPPFQFSPIHNFHVTLHAFLPTDESQTIEIVVQN